LTSGSQFRPPAPPSLKSFAWAADFNLVKAIGSANSRVRTPKQTETAKFWGYGPGSSTPPGHWNQVAQAVLRSRTTSIEENSRLFALLNIAMADAGIVSWDCKYVFNFWRPIAAIREAATDGNSLTTADPNWTPLLETPPFPEYTSGHSTFSAAAAVALAHFFKTDRMPFTVGSDDLPTVQRSYERFSEAAIESGLSRIYGGIHFMAANIYGLSTGTSVGLYVSSHVLKAVD
jgi:hypothetical protein